MGVYSFLNINATLAGPGGVINIGAGASIAEEGITIEATEDKNVMTIGADGKGQHSLVASNAATITVRLLKAAPANAALMIMYDLQSVSSALWGQNVITVADPARLDLIANTGVAFKKKPTITYAKEGGMMEWVFDVIQSQAVLGANQ